MSVQCSVPVEIYLCALHLQVVSIHGTASVPARPQRKHHSNRYRLSIKRSYISDRGVRQQSLEHNIKIHIITGFI